jgi:hypothetical protein
MDRKYLEGSGHGLFQCNSQLFSWKDKNRQQIGRGQRINSTANIRHSLRKQKLNSAPNTLFGIK